MARGRAYPTADAREYAEDLLHVEGERRSHTAGRGQT